MVRIKINQVWKISLLIISLYGCTNGQIYNEEVRHVPSDKSFTDLFNYLYLDSTASDSSEIFKILDDSIISFSANNYLELVTSINMEEKEHSHIFIKTNYHWPHIDSRLFINIYINKDQINVNDSEIKVEDIFHIGYKYYYEPDSLLFDRVFRLVELDSLGESYSSGVGAFFFVKIDSLSSNQKVNWSLLFRSLHGVNDILVKRRNEFSQKYWKSNYVDLPFDKKIIIDDIVPSKINFSFD